MNPELRRQVINIYKGGYVFSDSFRFSNAATELLEMGKSYPLGYSYFQRRLHKAFTSQAHLTDEAKIRQAIKRAEFVRNEIEALYGVCPIIFDLISSRLNLHSYFLKKYRSLKQSYS